MEKKSSQRKLKNKIKRKFILNKTMATHTVHLRRNVTCRLSITKIMRYLLENTIVFFNLESSETCGIILEKNRLRYPDYNCVRHMHVSYRKDSPLKSIEDKKNLR